MFGGKNKGEKVNKIKSAWPQRVSRIVLWILVIFLVFRGIGVVLRPNAASTTQTVLKDFEAKSNYNSRVEKEASAFAQMFAMEYLTYSGNNDDYFKRLKKYMSIELPGGSPNDNIQAISCEPFRIQWRDKNKISVDCKVKVRYTVKPQQIVQNPEANASDTLPPTAIASTPQTPIVTVEDTYLRIPIVEQNSNYLVEDLPVFVAAPVKADKPDTSSIGKEVLSEKKKEIAAVVENFLKAYCSGNNVEISYYMEDPKAPVFGLNKRYTLKILSTDNFIVREMGESGNYFINVQFDVTDRVNGQAFRQGMELNVVFENGKYLIRKYDVKLKIEENQKK